MHRRTLLSGLTVSAAAGFAGCIDDVLPEDQPRYDLEVTVQNDHDRAYDVRIVVTDGTDATVFEQSFTLGPGEGRGFSDDFPAGEYTIVVELPDRGESRSYWNTDLCEAHRVRTHIAADGHLTHHVTCHSGDRGSTTA
ncbi:hypothetical protein [Natronomonas amylolytica]|uniref:hypothetical protein n=1 Tax=Natronomonas amylolytica TaxID=3108498 RepID=UPI00300B55C6